MTTARVLGTATKATVRWCGVGARLLEQLRTTELNSYSQSNQSNQRQTIASPNYDDRVKPKLVHDHKRNKNLQRNSCPKIQRFSMLFIRNKKQNWDKNRNNLMHTKGVSCILCGN